MNSNFNQERLCQRIKECISMIIVQGEIKNPHLSTFVSVSEVSLSKDKSYATIYISSFVSDNKLEQSCNALQKSSSFIQAKLSKVLKTRNTPRLLFRVDTSYRDSEEVNRLIESLNEKK